MCTLDFGILYTNIPYSDGIHAASELLATHRNPNIMPQNN